MRRVGRLVSSVPWCATQGKVRCSPSSPCSRAKAPARGSGWLRFSHPLRCAPRPRGRQVGAGKQALRSNRKAGLQSTTYHRNKRSLPLTRSPMATAYIAPLEDVGMRAAGEETPWAAVTRSFRSWLTKRPRLGSIQVRQRPARSGTLLDEAIRPAIRRVALHATLATGRVLALTRAGLSPAGPDQLILTHPQISGRPPAMRRRKLARCHRWLR
jgi:hypothetical protein